MTVDWTGFIPGSTTVSRGTCDIESTGEMWVSASVVVEKRVASMILVLSESMAVVISSGGSDENGKSISVGRGVGPDNTCFAVNHNTECNFVPV